VPPRASLPLPATPRLAGGGGGDQAAVSRSTNSPPSHYPLSSKPLLQPLLVATA
jgi:hypothetical protein